MVIAVAGTSILLYCGTFVYKSTLEAFIKMLVALQWNIVALSPLSTHYSILYLEQVAR